MFQGSENYNGEFFKPLEEVGATDINGTTNFDRTNYFQNVPTTALDLALWMESDRMGHLLGAIDQARLDEQRGVVQNEKRQGENQPYGRVFDSVVSASFPAGHPYHHSRSARWTTSTPRRSTTSRTGSAPITARTTRCWCSPATSMSPLRAAGAEVLRRHPAGPGDHAARDLGRGAHGVHARDDGRPGGADASAPLLEHPAGRHHGSRSAGPGGRDPRRRQDLAARRAPGVPRPDRRQRLRRPERARDRGAVRHHGRREAGRRRTARSKRRSRRSCAASCQRARRRPSSIAPGGGARQLHQRPRAHRRLRRQGRRAGILRGVRSAIRAAIDDRCAWSRRRRPSSCGWSSSAGSHRATTRSRCDRFPRTTPPRPAPSIGAADLPVIDTYPDLAFPTLRAREARKRHTGHPCQPTERAGGAGRRALRCRLRGGS